MGSLNSMGHWKYIHPEWPKKAWKGCSWVFFLIGSFKGWGHVEEQLNKHSSKWLHVVFQTSERHLQESCWHLKKKKKQKHLMRSILDISLLTTPTNSWLELVASGVLTGRTSDYFVKTLNNQENARQNEDPSWDVCQILNSKNDTPVTWYSMEAKLPSA